MKILDAHTHLLPREIAENTSFYKAGWSDVDGLLRTMDNARIEQSLLLYPTTDAHKKMSEQSLCLAYNNGIKAIADTYTGRLIPAGILPTSNTDAAHTEIGRLAEMGFSALSFASSDNGVYLDDARFLPLLSHAAENGMTVFVHAQTENPIGFDRIKDPLLMPVVEYLFDITMCAGRLMTSGIFRTMETLKIVFAHFGGVLPMLADRFDTTYTMLRARSITPDLGATPCSYLKNIYVDTSGVKSISILNAALEFFGADRILWGSDYPAQQNPQTSLEALSQLHLSDDEMEKILSENLTLLLKKGDSSCR